MVYAICISNIHFHIVLIFFMGIRREQIDSNLTWSLVYCLDNNYSHYN